MLLAQHNNTYSYEISSILQSGDGVVATGVAQSSNSLLECENSSSLENNVSDVNEGAETVRVNQSSNSSCKVPSDAEFVKLKNQILEAYERVVKWRGNIFDVPKGKLGKMFVAEMSKWIDRWCDNTKYRDFSFYALSIMPCLLHQKTTHELTSKEKKAILERRFVMWNAGDIRGLLRECQSLQNRLSSPVRHNGDISNVARRFRNLMMVGNVNGALRLLEVDGNAGGVLEINDSTTTLLYEKHPTAEPMYRELLLSGPINSVEPVIFYSITPELIRKLILRTKGAAGPSLLNADEWRRIAGSKLFGAEGMGLIRVALRMELRSVAEKARPKPIQM